ncbi:MAG: nucleoside deaminase [Bacilli bacterium]|nr:nucleoside deaminase [Bacilli bacterium]
MKKIEDILYKLALKAYKKGEIPVSALIVKNNKIIAKAYNKKNISNNALYHAEILCLIKAYKKLKRWNLSDCSMYVSLEPCDLCKLAIQESRINNVFYILSKGNNSNFYSKTKYEQMYVSDVLFKKLFDDIFKKIRKKI